MEPIMVLEWQTFAMTVKAWRRAASAIDGWPQIDVEIPDRSRYWVSAWERFPVSLCRDCQAWCDRLAGRDLTCLGDLVEIEAFKTALRFFLDRESGKPTTAIADLATTLKAVARHHVRVEPHHLDQIGAIIRRLAPSWHGLTETNRTRLRYLRHASINDQMDAAMFKPTFSPTTPDSARESANPLSAAPAPRPQIASDAAPPMRSVPMPTYSTSGAFSTISRSS
jgi:hypothetical protein